MRTPAKWLLSLGGLHTKFIPHISGGWKTEIWSPACLGLGESPLCQWPLFSLCPHVAKEEQKTNTSHPPS